MKKAPNTTHSCREEVNNPGFSQLVAYQPFDGLNAETCLKKASYELISIPTNESTLTAASKSGPFVVTCTKSYKLKLYRVTPSDFDAEDKATAHSVCSYTKLNQRMSAAATHNQHLLVGGQSGGVHLYAIPAIDAPVTKNLKPSKQLPPHQHGIVACDISASHFVTGDNSGVVNCWSFDNDTPCWTIDTTETLFDARLTPSNKVVVATNGGDFTVHVQVFTRGNKVYDSRLSYEPRQYDILGADCVRLASMQHVVAVNFKQHTIATIDATDSDKATTTAFKPAYRFSGSTVGNSCVQFFSRANFLCVLQKRKQQKDWQLTVCKNQAEPKTLEYATSL